MQTHRRADLCLSQLDHHADAGIGSGGKKDVPEEMGAEGDDVADALIDAPQCEGEGGETDGGERELERRAPAAPSEGDQRASKRHDEDAKRNE